ncbi:RecF/RecN/SMC domain-containing protein, partial [Rozella allomycis CSF55]
MVSDGTPRLTLSKMVLVNFKSYAGRQTIGPFHKSFSSIVGPNGSGKSNVIDALLFVFGFRAKKMRQGKLSDLIHNSKEYPNLEYCAVEIYFEEIIDLDNGEYKVVPDTAMTIIRTANKQNKSTYTINGQNYSFSQIAQDEKDALQDKKEEAENYLRMENEIAKKQNLYYQIKIDKVEREYGEVKEEITRVKEEIEKEEKSHLGQIEEIKEMENNYVLSEKEYQILKGRVEEMGKEIGKMDKEEIQMQEKKKYIMNKQKKITKNIQSEKSELGLKMDNVKSVEEETQSNDKEIEVLKERLIKEEETDVFQVELEKKQVELSPWTEKIFKVESEIKILNSEKELLDEKINYQENAEKKIKEEIKKIEKTIQDKRPGYEEGRKEFEVLKSLSREVEEEIKKIEEKEEEKKEILSNLSFKINEKKNESMKMNNRNLIMENIMKEKNSGRIKGIHGRLGDLGMIEEEYEIAICTVCSRLDNIVVDSTESAEKCLEIIKKRNLGRATFIVLDKLDKIKMKSENLPMNSKRLFDLIKPKDEVYLKAFYLALGETLVTDNLNNANKIAFNSGKRYKVVTLDGKIIDSCGTLTGGGNKVIKGRIELLNNLNKHEFIDKGEFNKGELLNKSELNNRNKFKQNGESRKEDLEKMEKDFQDEIKNLDEIKRNKMDLIVKLNQLNQLISTNEVKFRKMEMEISSLENELNQKNKNLNEIKRSSNSPNVKDLERFKKINSEISKKDLEI